MTRLVSLHSDTSAWAHPDELLVQIAEYVHDYIITDTDIFEMARLCLLDSLSCAIMALKEPHCRNLLGPVVPGTQVAHGARVPGTKYELDPIKAAFDLGVLIRWLDFNDTWLAKEWGHPSDNIGGILMVADYISRQRQSEGEAPLNMQEVFNAIVKAYEIQGVLALGNSFNKVGLDHVILVKLATAAVTSLLVGGGMDQTISAMSNVWLDGHSLRTYRHGVNTGPRKSWAAGDATSRGVFLTWLTAFSGEPGYPHAITAKKWGFSDALFKGKAIRVLRPFGTYILDNILFKVKYPAEFHGQTAVEAATILHEQVIDKFDTINKIEIHTQKPAMQIINKTGNLNNYADRDHCLQYMVAVGLLYGYLEQDHYSDQFAAEDSRIDLLREKMVVKESASYSKGYLEPDKRTISNSVQIFFNDGTKTDKVEIHYPLGHKNRRTEAASHLRDKYNNAIKGHYQGDDADALMELWSIPKEILGHLYVDKFIELWSLM